MLATVREKTGLECLPSSRGCRSYWTAQQKYLEVVAMLHCQFIRMLEWSARESPRRDGMNRGLRGCLWIDCNF